jgi:bifunctional non-homologous end joining protein LigD
VSPAAKLAIELGASRGDIDGRKIVPMLCGRDDTGGRILAQPGYLFELKLDGVRIVADKRGADVALGYRRGRDATASYPEIVSAVASLSERRLVLDGEVVAFAADGRPDFQRLGTRIQSSGEAARRAMVRVPVVYVVFDLLVVDDRDLTRLPIEARKAILDKVLEAAPETRGLVTHKARAPEGRTGHLRLQPTLTDGQQLFALCRERGLEGVVAKRAGSIYRADDRSTDWVKVKCELDADLVVVGWTPGEGMKTTLGALDVGAYDGDRLVFCGSVGSGLDAETIVALAARLGPLEVERPVAEGKYRAKAGRRYVRPEIVVSVRHMGLTPERALKHPVFRGVRDDLSPEDCTLEGAAGTPTR